MVARLAEAQPLWAVSTPALAAMRACSGERALAEADTWARELAVTREAVARGLTDLGLHVVPDARASFLCVRAPGLRSALRERGYAVRRGDTFPGLGAEWTRVAVRDPVTMSRFLDTVRESLTLEKAQA
jgi:histidinol-phosphate aminotransferase